MSNNINKMKKNLFSEEFDKFIKNSFSRTLRNFEKERQKRTQQAVAIKVILSLLFIYGISAYIVLLGQYITQLLFIIFFGIVIIAIVGEIPIYQYKKSVKKILYPKLLSFFGNFKILESKDRFEMDRLYKYIISLQLFEYCDDCSFRDVIIGTYKDLEVKIAEITPTKQQQKKDKSYPVFYGLLFSFKSFKNFSSKTIIKRKGEPFYQNLQKVDLEDPVFESLYDVYSNDQIESRRLITPAFMNRMVKSAQYNEQGYINVSFEQKKVNIAIPSHKDWFEVSVDKPATNIDVYRKVLLEIYDILSFIDDLKLDEDIGM